MDHRDTKHICITYAESCVTGENALLRPVQEARQGGRTGHGQESETYERSSGESIRAGGAGRTSARGKRPRPNPDSSRIRWHVGTKGRE